MRKDIGREMGKMRDIYPGASITISAAYTQTSEDGFLHACVSEKHQDPRHNNRIRWDGSRTGRVLLAAEDSQIENVTYSQ